MNVVIYMCVHMYRLVCSMNYLLRNDYIHTFVYVDVAIAKKKLSINVQICHIEYSCTGGNQFKFTAIWMFPKKEVPQNHGFQH